MVLRPSSHDDRPNLRSAKLWAMKHATFWMRFNRFSVRARACVCVCVCVREKRKIVLMAWGGKSAHSPRQDLNLYLWDAYRSCFRLHHESRHASCQLKQTPHTHSPTSSIVKHKHALRNTPTPIRGTATASGRLQGPPLSRKRRVRERRKIELTAWGKSAHSPQQDLNL